jgi:hypothetical protein
LKKIYEKINLAKIEGSKPFRVEFSKEAKKKWKEQYSLLSSERYGLRGSLTSRAEAQVIRNALIYTILDNSKEIGLQHLEAALSLWSYCQESVHYIFGDQIGDENADKVIDALKEVKIQALERTQIIKEVISKNKSKKEIERVKTLLLDMEKITLGKRGNAEVWRLI